MHSIAQILIALCFTASQVVISTAAKADAPVLVFAAASTREALDTAIERFDNDTGRRVVGVYAASSALARQVIDGAPASLLISANRAWMDHVAKAGLVARQTELARNRLVLASTALDPVPAVRSGDDFARAAEAGRLAVAETIAVPAGIYARQAMQSLGVWKRLRGRLAQSANVRAALLLVERGEAPLGLVYRTDALASRLVHVAWTVPAKTHDPIVYPLALLRGGADDPLASRFYDHLVSPSGLSAFAEHGFEIDQ